MYIAKNSKTGETKQFINYREMQAWWKRLSQQEMFQWTSWDYIEQ